MTTTTDEALAKLRIDFPCRQGRGADVNALIDEIGRLRAIVADDLIHSADWQRIADIRAAGYADGQLAMRERAAEALECKCPHDAVCVYCLRGTSAVVRALEITPEPTTEGASS